MDLLERYLQAVREYLPARGSADVLAELWSNLLEELDARTEELGRPLTEDDVAEVLRHHGHPSAVAARYQPQRALIGPEVFPYYWFTLKRTLPLVLGLFVVARAVETIYLFPAPLHAGSLLGQTVTKLFTVLFWFAGGMTLVFAALDWVRGCRPERMSFYARWDPRKLPPLATPKEREGLPKHPRADIAFHLLGLAWLFLLPGQPSLLFFVAGPVPWIMSGAAVALTPLWHGFYWALVGLNLLQLVFKLVALLPSAQPWRRPIKLIYLACGFTLLALLQRVREYLVFAQPMANAARQHLLEQLNTGVHRALLLAAVLLGAKLLWDIGQYVQQTRQHRAMEHTVA